MGEPVRWPDAEIKRREDYMRFGSQEFDIKDPYTWSLPAKGAGFAFAVGSFAIHYLNLYQNKRWYHALYPRMGVLAVGVAMGYGVGLLRQKYNINRDAYVTHYTRLHPEDFERLNDTYGRPLSAVLMPWYPKRSLYQKFEKPEEA
ncbi:unnamed protein product [Bursaphelenchus xylophilus]|uniref:(pine wood nematode) hypothetical protein n=1 Tax=Bursaphelenchus xylophilus TaxID=6326 RepID=A0A1I7STN0_BURXY|nr:unnamed protein product [Bursaphelenchus xylophilus]CAG9108196.1 unnamed protein product [Bursaphelenchus xylophilus]